MLKAKTFWGHKNNLFRQWKVRTIFEAEYTFKIGTLRFLQIKYIRAIKMPIKLEQIIGT